MRVGRVRGSQRKVDNLVREFERIKGEVYAARPDCQFDRPSIGWHRAVCVDVVDLGLVEGRYGERHLVEFVWQLEERKHDTGRRFLAWRRFGLSLADHATLRRFLEVWQGYPFAAHELQAGIPLASRYVGLDGLLLIEARAGDEGKVWRNVAAGYPLPAKAPRVKPDGYVRKVWRSRKGDARAADVRDGSGSGAEGGAAGDARAHGPHDPRGAPAAELLPGGADDAGTERAGEPESGAGADGGTPTEGAPADRAGSLHEAWVRYRVGEGRRPV